MGDAKWLIGFVNYYTKGLLFYQMRRLSRLQNKSLIRLVIVDNSSTSEADDLSCMARNLGLRDSVTVINNSKCRLSGSHAHAEGLNIVLGAKTDEDFLLTQDPDFFWLIPDHLSFLGGMMRDGIVAVGSPYRRKVGCGQADFPSAWGAAYNLKMLQAGDFDVYDGDDIRLRYPPPEYDFSGDVGWIIRERLSSCKAIAFDQRPAEDLSAIFGVHSFEARPVEYFHHGRLVALHLFRGSFPMAAPELYADVAKGKPPVGPNVDWNITKLKFAKAADVISRSRVLVWAYCQYCKMRWDVGTAPSVDDYESYYFMQRMTLPYKNQRTQMLALRKRTKQAAMPHLDYFISQTLNDLNAERVYESICESGSLDQIAANLAVLDGVFYGSTRGEEYLKCIAQQFLRPDGTPYPDAATFLHSVQNLAGSKEWDNNFDRAYAQFQAALEAMRFLYDGRTKHPMFS